MSRWCKLSTFDGDPCVEYLGMRIMYWDKYYLALKKLAELEDLEEQGRLIDWKRTSEEKPGSTRHVIVADGAIISHYGYYLKPKDKWFTDWTCEKEIDAPMFWMDMPEPPKESLHGDRCAKMDEVE